jgi:hypothetical protein
MTNLILKLESFLLLNLFILYIEITEEEEATRLGYIGIYSLLCCKYFSR